MTHPNSLPARARVPAWAGRALLSVHSIITRLAITVLEGDRGKYKIVYKVENYLQSEKRKFSVPGVE